MELLLILGERLAEHNLHQVAEVIARVERYPVDVIHQDQPRAHQESTELEGVDAVLLMHGKVDPGFGKHTRRLLRVHVVLEREFEVELPGARSRDEMVPIGLPVRIRGIGRRNLPLRRKQCNTELDHFQKVDVAPQRLVVVIGLVREGTDGTSDDARKFGVLL